MILYVWIRNDQTGLLDDEFRDGDIDHIVPDSFEGNIGLQEKKSWLIVKMADPPDFERFQEAIQASEYTTGPSPEIPRVRRNRSFRVDWRNKFSASEIAVITNASQMLPDGPTSGGGSVTSGVVSALFAMPDIVRK